MVLKRILIHTRSASIGSLQIGLKGLAIRFKDVAVFCLSDFRCVLRLNVAMTVFVILRRNWNLGVYVVTNNLCAGNIRIVFYYYQAKISYKHVAARIRFVIEIWRTQGL